MKTVIIGDPGTCAYIFFRYLIWNETLENFIVVDDINNKEHIGLLDDKNFKLLFYDFRREDFCGITSDDIKGSKTYINAPNKFQIQYDWLLCEEDGVLRISMNDLRAEFIKNIKHFDNIIIFNPCDEDKKKCLASIFNWCSREILSFSKSRKEEYITIIKQDLIKQSILQLNENFPL